MLDKKQIWAMFLFEFKMGHKAADTTRNSHTFSLGTTNEHKCSVRSRSVQEVLQGTDSLEDEQRSGWPLEADNDQLRAITKVDPLTTTWEAAKELNIDHYMVIRHLKQIGKVKKLDKWVPHELTKNQKIVVLKCSLILYDNEPFLDWVMTCDEKWIL